MEDNVAVVATYIGRSLRNRLDGAARQCGITGLQWRMLAALKQMPGSNQGALASALGAEPIAAGRMIDRLEKLELIERRRDPADRRAWRLFITQSSEQLMVQLAQKAEVVSDDVLVGFSAEERVVLLELLTRMRVNLSDGCPSDGFNFSRFFGPES